MKLHQYCPFVFKKVQGRDVCKSYLPFLHFTLPLTLVHIVERTFTTIHIITTYRPLTRRTLNFMSLIQMIVCRQTTNFL